MIKSEFLKLVGKIEASPEAAFGQHKLQFSEPVDTAHILKVIDRYLSGHQYGSAIKFATLYLGDNRDDDEIKKLLIDIISEHIFPWILLDPNIYTANSELFDQLKEHYLENHKAQPDEPIWMVGLAMLSMRTGADDNAGHWLSKAIAIVEKNTPMHALTLSNFGWHEFRQSNAEKYLEYNRLAYEAYPSVKYKMQLALALEHVGEIEEAIEHLTELLEGGKSDANLHRKLGHLLKQVGNFEKSISHMMIAEGL